MYHHTSSSVLSNSTTQFRKIAPYFRYFLLFYVILAMLPIHRLTGSNIQSIVGDGLLGHGTNIMRVLWTVLYLFAFLTNDIQLIAGLIFFAFYGAFS